MYVGFPDDGRCRFIRRFIRDRSSGVLRVKPGFSGSNLESRKLLQYEVREREREVESGCSGDQ